MSGHHQRLILEVAFQVLLFLGEEGGSLTPAAPVRGW